MTVLSEKKLKTRDLILQAAAKVFTEEGIKGATTRQIASVAGINESTLFRNFATKQQLLKAVVDMTAAEISNAVFETKMLNNDLKKDLIHFATTYNKALEEKEAFIRMFISEVRRYPEEAQCIAHDSWKPLQLKMTTYFEEARKKGLIRQDLDLDLSIDIFRGIVLIGVLKRGVHPEPDKHREQYLKTAIELFIRGISPL